MNSKRQLFFIKIELYYRYQHEKFDPGTLLWNLSMTFKYAYQKYNYACFYLWQWMLIENHNQLWNFKWIVSVTSASRFLSCRVVLGAVDRGVELFLAHFIAAWDLLMDLVMGSHTLCPLNAPPGGQCGKGARKFFFSWDQTCPLTNVSRHGFSKMESLVIMLDLRPSLQYGIVAFTTNSSSHMFWISFLSD